MKTFQEALDTCAIDADSNNPESIAKAMERATQLFHQYEGVVREAASHEMIHALIDATTNRHDGPEGCDVHSVALSVFVLGLQIGMEMEKCERCRVEGELAMRIAEAQS